MGMPGFAGGSNKANVLGGAGGSGGEPNNFGRVNPKSGEPNSWNNPADEKPLPISTPWALTQMSRSTMLVGLMIVRQAW